MTNKEQQLEELRNIILSTGGVRLSAQAIYDAGYRKVSKDFIGTDNVLRSIDYRPTKEVAQEILQKAYDSFVEEFVKSAEIQEFVGVRNILRNVCPAKTHKIIRRIAKEYEVEVEYEKQ